jgi:ADP-ribose pyrophosphatase YjhB (NUDIX family)
MQSRLAPLLHSKLALLTRHATRERKMASSREYPERPLVGVGGVVIEGDLALLIRRGTEPHRGEWSIPGGMLELGETLEQGVSREVLEETGLQTRVTEIIEVFERIYWDEPPADTAVKRPRFHYVIADYLCEKIGGAPMAGSDVTELAFSREEDLPAFHLTPTATRILHKAFAMYRARQG